MSNSEQQLNECGCCEGVKALTPVSIENLPGLSALVYRVGTHGAFKATMQASLSGEATLRQLTTRDDDDPTIATLDGWATVLDVLSFYQERIANEGYLRTATERRSILEMARSIGYELRPGIAAGTFLAFRLETAPGSPLSAKIPTGTKAQSMPAQGETPQIFETSEDITGYAAWNEIKAKQTEKVLPKLGLKTLYLKGTATNLKPGDAILIVGDERAKDDPGNENWDFRLLTSVTAVSPPPSPASEGYTIITLDHPLGSITPRVEPAAKNPRIYALRQRASLFGYNAPDWRAMPESLRASYIASYMGLDPTDSSLDKLVKDQKEWPHFTIADVSGAADKIHLDAIYPKIVNGSWIVLSIPEFQEVYKVTEGAESSSTNFALTAKTTRLTLQDEDLAKYNNQLRDTVVFGQSEELEFAEKPIEDPVAGIDLLLNSKVEGLVSGQLIAITGNDSNTGDAIAEIATIDRVEDDNGFTKLVLKAALTNSYDRETALINANVARSTHGDTKNEVLGSGDGSKPFQKFQLKQNPLTFISAPTPSGGQTTLKVRVNDVLWHEVPNLYELPSNERAYVTRIADDGKVTVQFGDSVTGARLPTGTENVTAKYRVGIGSSGMLAANQINLLMSRPLGVKDVINPLAPTGAADPEKLEDARRNAPLTVLTLDRIVSLQDFEDFARAFSGIGKAQATWLWNGQTRMIHLTITGVDGGDVPANSDLYRNLVKAIDAARHTDQTVRIDAYQSRLFSLEAKIIIDPDYLFEDVKNAVQKALADAFSFETRSFGQAVTVSEVDVTAQAVAGVVAVDIDKLYFDDASPSTNERLPADVAHWEGNQIKPAELLTVNANRIKLTEMR
jgi:predicted phage baseplate assembly protein